MAPRAPTYSWLKCRRDSGRPCRLCRLFRVYGYGSVSMPLQDELTHRCARLRAGARLAAAAGSAAVAVMRCNQPTRAPVSSGTPDPTLLPVATTSQGPLTAAYDAFNVPAI